MSKDFFGSLIPVAKSKVARNYTDNTWSGMVTAGLNTFSNFAFGDQGPLFAKVLRVEPSEKPPPGGWVENFQEGKDLENQVWLSIKARIPSIHSHLPDPFTYGQNAEDANLQINMHHTFTSIQPVKETEVPAPSDIIQVDFMDRVNLTYPVFVRNISQGFLKVSTGGAKTAFTAPDGVTNFKAQLIDGKIYANKGGVTVDPCTDVARPETLCNFRDADAYKTIIDETYEWGTKKQGSQNLARYTPKLWYGSGNNNTTFCNFFVKDVTDKMGVGVPSSTANQMIRTLKKGHAGWETVTRAQAVEAAGKGQPTIVGWINPKERSSGHVVMLRPNGKIANVGSTNNPNATIGRGFGTKGPLHYFTHK